MVIVKRNNHYRIGRPVRTPVLGGKVSFERIGITLWGPKIKRMRICHYYM